MCPLIVSILILGPILIFFFSQSFRCIETGFIGKRNVFYSLYIIGSVSLKEDLVYENLLLFYKTYASGSHCVLYIHTHKRVDPMIFLMYALGRACVSIDVCPNVLDRSEIQVFFHGVLMHVCIHHV